MSATIPTTPAGGTPADQDDETLPSESETPTTPPAGGQGDEDVTGLKSALSKERTRAEEAERELKRLKDVQTRAVRDAARKNGDFEQLAKDQETEIATLRQTIADLKAENTEREVSLIRERVGAKYHIPAVFVSLLQGSDEAAIEAHAKIMVKELGKREAPNPETGRGAGANGGKANIEDTKRALAASGRYGSIG